MFYNRDLKVRLKLLIFRNSASCMCERGNLLWFNFVTRCMDLVMNQMTSFLLSVRWKV